MARCSRSVLRWSRDRLSCVGRHGMWWMKPCFLPRKCRPPYCTLCFFHWKPWYDITMEIGQHLWSKIHHSVEIHTTSWKLDLHWGKNHCLCTCVPIQSCPTLCDAMDCSPPGSCPWDSPGRSSGVGCHFLLQGIPIHGSNLCLLTCVSFIDKWMLYHRWTSIFATLHAKPFILRKIYYWI